MNGPGGRKDNCGVKSLERVEGNKVESIGMGSSKDMQQIEERQEYNSDFIMRSTGCTKPDSSGGVLILNYNNS